MQPLQYLSEEQIKSIHETTLRSLNEIGFVWTHKESLEILVGAGCKVQDNRVYFPPELVEDSIEKAGKRVTIKGRNGASKTLGEGNLYFHNLGGARDVYDAKTGQRRIASEQDVKDAARLLDALENCHTVTPFFTPRDVPGELMSLYMYRHSIPHTTKPLQGPGIQFGQIDYKNIKIDKCSGCDGVWLDAGELETMSQLEKTGLDKFFGVFRK